MINYYRETQEINERNYIYILKFFALISIVSAHVSIVPENSGLMNIYASGILQGIANVGVAVFYLISGYLFYNNKDSLDVLFFKKVKTIIIPWLVTGFLVVTYYKIMGTNYTYFNFLIGNGSYLYFLTLLVVYYALFYKLRSSFFIWITMLFWLISVFLTANSFLENINPYLNPFNFIGYFSIGLLIKRKNQSLIDIGNLVKNKAIILVLLFVTSILFVNYFSISSGYFGNATLLLQTLGVLMIFSISNYSKLYNKLFIDIGKESFSIYLLHLPIAGLIVSLIDEFNGGFITLMRPVLVIAVVYIAIVIYKKINILGIKPEYKNMLIGTR